ncbi:signal peptide peptidase SppA [Asaia sp. As-1742]|uniref:signal peptide peptidase SppA n=1 Tax=Asaia sp. As-1742 TaxID=2608325 RepID=UPI00142146EE|nr:signal peptide peptidase SppA [Asaia sp. As-1742]NIE79703.1 signal peptide peptidase SppA [Asaia sp. As-1742]
MTALNRTNDDTPAVLLRQRRRLLFWRGIAVAALVATILVLFVPGRPHGPHDAIARLEITGVIGNRVRPTVEAIERAGRDPHIKGMLLVIDSPGGGVTGGEALHDAIAGFVSRKPVAVSMQGLAASAGYMIAVPAQRLFAYPSSITGSIGVIMMRPDASALLDRIGVKAETITSGPMKDQSQPFTALKPEGRQMLQGIVDDLFDQFVLMVAKGRHRPVEEIRQLADGRPYTGRQAVALHLIDQIGDEDQAAAWLHSQIKDGKDLPVRKLAIKKPDRTMWERFYHRFGGSWFAWPEAIDKVMAYQSLDGAVSILPR